MATRDERAVTGYLRKQRDRIRATATAARGGDPDALHDMRVATRRLRSTLRTFRPVLDRSRTEPLRAELRWLGHVLGEVRDGDVLAERLTRALGAEPPELVIGPVAARMRERLSTRTAQARRDLHAALDSPRYAALLDLLDKVVDVPPTRRVTRVRLIRLARKAVRRADRRLAAAARVDQRARQRRIPLPLPSAADRDVRLHRARRAYKRARYAAEVLRPVAGKPARRLAKRLTGLQDLLGAHQDSIVTRQLLRDYGVRAHLDGENAFSYGLLYGRQQRAGEHDLAGLEAARRGAGKARVRGWLRP
jgi:CHAD domain-containing protein